MKKVCNGYVTKRWFFIEKVLVLNTLVCNGYVIKPSFIVNVLFDGHLMMGVNNPGFLFDGHVIDPLKILFDGYLMISLFLLKIALIIRHFLFDGYLTTPALYPNPYILNPMNPDSDK